MLLKSPVGISEGFLFRERSQYGTNETLYSPLVTFSLDKHANEINTFCLKPNMLMDFMIRICINSKERGLKLFPIENPNNMQENKLKELTRKIFADSIGNLVSIWVSIWYQNQ